MASWQKILKGCIAQETEKSSKRNSASVISPWGGKGENKVIIQSAFSQAPL